MKPLEYSWNDMKWDNDRNLEKHRKTKKLLLELTTCEQCFKIAHTSK